MGLNRDVLLQSTQTKALLEQVPLVVTYHPGLLPLKSVLNKHLSILSVSHSLSRAIRHPSLVTCRRLLNLKNLLVRARFGFYNNHTEVTPSAVKYVVRRANTLRQWTHSRARSQGDGIE